VSVVKVKQGALHQGAEVSQGRCSWLKAARQQVRVRTGFRESYEKREPAEGALPMSLLEAVGKGATAATGLGASSGAWSNKFSSTCNVSDKEHYPIRSAKHVQLSKVEELLQCCKPELK